MKVLLIRLSSLGDVVLATSAVEALREELPAARVEVLTKPEFRSVFAGNPGIDGLLEWDRTKGLGGLVRLVREGRYDWIVDLHANLRTRALRLLTPGAHWSMYRKGVLRRRLAVRLRRPGLLAGQPHVVRRYLAALAPLGVSGEPRLPVLHLDEDTRGVVGSLLVTEGWAGDRPLVGLAPGARWATKAWPFRHWVELARQLGESGRRTLLMVGGRDESDLCRDVLREAGVAGVNLAGRTSIRETAAALERCDVLVTNDSAPLHLATAVGTRVVALFGPTVQAFGFWPLGRQDTVMELDLPCRPCRLHGSHVCPLGHHRCLEDLPWQKVHDATTEGCSGGAVCR
jgi:heptosyltransferase-2